LGLSGLLDAQVDVATSNALSSSCGYVTTPQVASLLLSRQQFAGPTGPALWQGNMNDGTILGFRAMSSAQVPTAGMLFGDWSSVVVGEWGVLELVDCNN
jgi:hypothetical protein